MRSIGAAVVINNDKFIILYGADNFAYIGRGKFLFQFGRKQAGKRLGQNYAVNSRGLIGFGVFYKKSGGFLQRCMDQIGLGYAVDQGFGNVHQSAR